MKTFTGCVVLALGALGCSSKKANEAAGAASASAAPLDAAEQAAAVTVDASSVDAAPAVAAAGGTFLLVSDDIIGETAVVLGKLEGEPALTDDVGKATFHEDENSEFWTAARPLAAMPPARASLANTRLDLHGADGKLCTVTVGQPWAVRSGTVSGDLGVEVRMTARAGKPIAPAPLWKAAGGGLQVDATFVAAAVTDAAGSCDGALFAVAAGESVARTPLRAAKEWDGSLDAFRKAGLVTRADEKHELEGSGSLSSFTSARRLGPAEGPSLAVLYGKSGGARTVVVLRVPGVDVDEGTVVGALHAPAPSTVVGVDADRDGVLDVIIGHDDGVALVNGNGGGEQVVLGGLEDVDD